MHHHPSQSRAFGALLASITGLIEAVTTQHLLDVVIGVTVTVVGHLVARALSPSADVVGTRIAARITGRHDAVPPPEHEPPRELIEPPDPVDVEPPAHR